jgi:hypothetical protein
MSSRSWNGSKRIEHAKRAFRGVLRSLAGMHSQFSFDEMKSHYAVERRWVCQIIRADTNFRY